VATSWASPLAADNKPLEGVLDTSCSPYSPRLVEEVVP
jgi:hypothetical protein